MSKAKGNVADMMAILSDMEQSNACCHLILNGEFNNRMRVKRALYESALISYRRALANGSTRIPSFGNKVWKFDKVHNQIALNGVEKEGKEIFELSNKCIAHRANEEARKVTLPSEDGTGTEVIKTSYIEKLDLIIALNTITKRYIDLLQKDLVINTSMKAGMISIPKNESGEKNKK